MQGFDLIGKYSSRGDRHMLLVHVENADNVRDWQDREYRIEYHRMGDLVYTITAIGYVAKNNLLRDEVFKMSTRGGIALMDRMS